MKKRLYADSHLLIKSSVHTKKACDLVKQKREDTVTLDEREVCTEWNRSSILTMGGATAEVGVCDGTGGLLSRRVRGYSESLLSELDPLELVLPDSDELLLLSREGPPEGAEPALSEGDGQVRGAQPHAPRHLHPLSFSRTHTGFTPLHYMP